MRKLKGVHDCDVLYRQGEPLPSPRWASNRSCCGGCPRRPIRLAGLDLPGAVALDDDVSLAVSDFEAEPTAALGGIDPRPGPALGLLRVTVGGDYEVCVGVACAGRSLPAFVSGSFLSQGRGGFDAGMVIPLCDRGQVNRVRTGRETSLERVRRQPNNDAITPWCDP